MPGGGLYSLVAYGAQNVLLSGNPDFTYFYKSYKKYSHFAEESVTFSMDGPQSLSVDQTTPIRFKLQRIADLVRDIYFVCDLPDIYCKYVDLNTSTRTAQYNFAWVEYIGCHMIQSVGFYIGGQKIQEMDGTYLIAKAQIDMDAFTFQKWQRLVGHLPELYDPANGPYGGGSTGTGYPLVYNNKGPTASVTTNVNVNRPSIQGRRLQIPLPFWFAESTFEALPLVSLQQQECEIQIRLRPIQELYRILDANGYQVAPGYQYNPSPLSIQPQNVYYTPVSDSSDQTIDNFLTDIDTPKPLLKTWPLQPRLQLTYVYVTDEERAQFASHKLEYLVRQITRYDFDSLTSRQLLKLDTHNPIERLILVPRRSDSLLYRNQSHNFTNWINPYKAPFLATDGGWPAPVNLISSSGQTILNAQQSIIRSLTLLGDGNPLQEEKPAEYFTEVVPFKYCKGIPDPGVIVYPFSLGSPTTQPFGSINSSRIKSFQVDVNVFGLPSTSYYQYNISIYVESLNWVTITAGTGGLKYAL